MSFAAINPDDALNAAEAELEEARSTERAIRLLVAEGKTGASSLATAQWRLQKALERLDRLGWHPPTPTPPDPYGADLDGDDYAA